MAKSKTEHPTITESLHNNTRLTEKPEQMSSKKRILYELENVLDLKDKELELEALNKTTGRITVSTRCLYKIYKGILEEKDLQPSCVYTGCSIMEKETVDKLTEAKNKELEDYEVTI